MKYYRLALRYNNNNREKENVFDFEAVSDDEARVAAQGILSNYEGSESYTLYCIGEEIPVDVNESSQPVAQLIAQENGSSIITGESTTNYLARTSYLVRSDYDFVAGSATNITSVTNIDKLQGIGDYQAMWYMMASTVTLAGGIGSLSSAEQVIATSWLTMDKRKVSLLIRARRERMNKVSAMLWNELDRTQAEEMMDDITQSALLTKYIEENRQGTAQGDQVGITDYINSLGVYSGVGFISKAWVPSSMTLVDLANTMIDILVYGGS